MGWTGIALARFDRFQPPHFFHDRASDPCRELEVLPRRHTTDSLDLFDAKSHMKLDVQRHWRRWLLVSVSQSTTRSYDCSTFCAVLHCATESEQGQSLAALSFGRPLRPGNRRLLATRLRRAGVSRLGDLAYRSRFRSSSTSGSMTALLHRLPAVQRLENRAPSPSGFVKMVRLGHAAEALTALRCHSNLEELCLRHSPGSLAVVVSRCTTARYGEQAQYAVSQCVADASHRIVDLPSRSCEYRTWYYTSSMPMSLTPEAES